MEGSVSIYVNRKDKSLSRGLHYTAPAGFGQTMGGVYSRGTRRA